MPRMLLCRNCSMPVTYSIDTARRLIRCACTSPMTFDEVINNFRALRVDPDCSGHMDSLVNLTAADLLLNSNQLRLATLEIKALMARAQFDRLAIVADRDAMYGMMRVFQVFASEQIAVIRVFRKLSEAESWLQSSELPDRTP